MASRNEGAAGDAVTRLGRFLYRWRSYTPLPLILLLLLRADPKPWSWAAGLPLVVAGEALRLAALRSIGGASRSRHVGAARLVTAGPYGAMRNPLYAGNLLLSSGLALASAIPYLPLLLAVLFAAQYGPIIACEERELETRFGEAYRRYKRQTPRFLPRRRGGGGEGAILSWGEAIRIERRSVAALSFLVVALALRAAGEAP